ncbi:hypothetical protein [Bacteroides sp. 51]|uniref:hypothetical protein n=1 Tax=Bacteroides sp. 51 TaxID=2302938 RepID=UPI0013D63873|nr:hypothetical protein [Bacteroides sp. 51]NDV84093.1 hypothetical protein [Bacteroides sp. 51]
MKKFISFFLLLSFVLTGCDNLDPDDDDDIIWDFLCHSIPMQVTDADGNNLFSAETPGGPWEQPPYVIYKDKKFDLYQGDPQYKDRTRELPPSFLELYLMKNTENEYYLCFGEFSPSSNYYGQPFTIYWGDGSKDEITFDLYITWKSKREPTVHHNIYLNGKPVTDTSYIPIIK